MNFESTPSFSKQKNLISDNLNHYMALDESGIRGFGSDEVDEIARKKALFEYLERLVMKSGEMGDARTSNGFATHTEKRLSELNAKSELIERDVFLCSWLMKQRMSKLEALPQNDLAKDLSKAGLELRPGVIGINSGVLCFGGWVIDPEMSRGIFVCSASSNIETGVRKIYEDGIQAGSVLQYYRENKETELKKLVDIHTNYYLEKENFDSIKWHWNEFEDDVLELPGFDIQVNTIEATLNNEISFFCSRAQSANAQDFFVGSTNSDKINKKRFEKLGVDSQQLNMQLHPLA